MKKVAFACAAVAMAGAMTAFTTAPAYAGVGHTTETVTIDTSAYNLRTARGYSALTDRIDRASEQVCGSVDGRTPVSANNIRVCQSGAVEDAMAQLNDIARSPSVTVGASR